MTKRSYAWRQRNGFAVESREPIQAKYSKEIWVPGPVRTEARRLAREVLKAEYAKKGKRLDLASENEIENGVTVLLFNSADIFLKRAKFNLGE